MELEIDSEPNYRVVKGSSEAMVYAPMLDVHQLEPSIIEGF